jgi:hypothetical protein
VLFAVKVSFSVSGKLGKLAASFMPRSRGVQGDVGGEEFEVQVEEAEEEDSTSGEAKRRGAGGMASWVLQ